MRKMMMAVAALCVLAFASDAWALNDGRIKRYATDALRTADTTAPVGTIGYAIDTTNFKWVPTTVGTWASINTGTTVTLAEGATLTNADDGTVVITEGGETMTIVVTNNLLTLAAGTSGATYAFTPAVGFTGDITASGGAGALTFYGTAASIVVDDTDTTALLIGAPGALDLMTFDSTDASPGVAIKGVAGQESFHLDAGTALIDETVSIGGGAGAITLTSTSATILTADNDGAPFKIGSSGAEASLAYSSLNNAEAFTFAAGVIEGTTSITGVVTLDASDCGKTHFVTAAADDDAISLPAPTAGCRISFMYVGADNGCQIELEPGATAAIHGSCTLAASVLEFDGVDSSDVELTKATSNTGDRITLIGDGSDWYVQDCAGIWAQGV